jgi:hypothetical protein
MTLVDEQNNTSNQSAVEIANESSGSRAATTTAM